MAASCNKNMNVSESKEHEESDHLEEEVNEEDHTNDNNGEVKTKKKKKKNKKKCATVSVVVNGEDPNHVKTNGELGQEEKDDEDAAESSLSRTIFYQLLALNL